MAIKPTFDRHLFLAAYSRFFGNPRALTDQDIEQFTAVDDQLAERARAKRAGEVKGSELKKMGRRPVTFRFLFNRFYEDFLVPIMSVHQMHTRAAHDRIDALQSRLEHLEAKPTPEYKGVYTDSTIYHSGSFVTRSGGLWLALHDTAAVPGSDPHAWRLVVKRGRDARK